MSGLKDIYSPVFYNRLANVLTQVLPSFDQQQFFALIFNPAFHYMELKERMRHTTCVVHEFMPQSYPDAVHYLYLMINKFRQLEYGEDALAFIFLPDYLEVYGLEDYETSVQAFEFVTQFITCEYGVRPFIIRYFKQMMETMQSWSLHESPKVRRLATEGSRPRLPWAMAIPQLKKDPSPILPILENLKNDPSEIVRRSVANNLNDISKDNPAVVLRIAKEWVGQTNEMDAIIKHGCRTLLKQGHTEILSHYGLDSDGLVLTDFSIDTPQVTIGDALSFSFGIQNTTGSSKTVRLEYGLYYFKANGKLAKKVFKISERIYQPGEKAVIERKQSFKLITTRVFYAGPHQLSMIINGAEQINAIQSFELLSQSNITVDDTIDSPI